MVKINLTVSKGHISVRIDQKWPKWRLFGYKMTSYVENGVKYDKKFSTLSTLTIETPNIYFLWVITKLTGSKGHISVQIYQKWSKRRLFGQKMMSYVENMVKYDKKFFQHYLCLLYTSPSPRDRTRSRMPSSA